MSPGFTRANGCDLCRAARITPWYYEDEICWIAECEICEVPMVVWRFHGTTPPDEHVVHMRERLREVATAQFGSSGWTITCATSPTTTTPTGGRRAASSATAFGGGRCEDSRDRADVRRLA